MTDTAALLNLARTHHQQGRIAEAEQLYRQVLAAEPGNVEALTLTGAAKIGLGRPDEAIELLGQAVAIAPEFAAAHDNLGVALAKLGRFAEAANSFQRATRLNPAHAPAWVNFGNALIKLGKLQEAVGPLQEATRRDPNSALAHFELAGLLMKLGRNDPAAAHYGRCVELQPGNVIAHFYRGAVLGALGRHQEAAASYERALQLKPDHPETLVNLGNALANLKRYDEAIDRLQRAIELRPQFAEARVNLGNALFGAGRIEQAIEALNDALRLQPDSSEAYNNLGNALVKQFKYAEAVEAYQNALRLKPEDPEPRYNLGSTYYRLREPQRAIDEVNRALELRPAYAEARYTRAVASLLRGDFRQGWADYESRWQCPEFKPRTYAQPLWTGEELGGRRILLFAEQGLGDTLQFIRYVKLVKQRGGVPIVEVHTPLLKVLAATPGLGEVRPLDANSQDFDVYAPLMSLPGILGTDAHSIPAQQAYLRADPQRVRHWAQELGASNNIRVGLAWQGNPSYPDDRLRSVPLLEIAPLGPQPGVEFISLQKGPGTEQLDSLPEQFQVRQLGADFDESAGPFVDTAAVMVNLDLILTSDTAVAHLAGALGRPVWILLPYAPDWRWMLERTYSLWYASARLFRQQSQGDWTSPVQEVAGALAKLAGSKRGA
jgi:tetratricopeptide (TPR) repeat protein